MVKKLCALFLFCCMTIGLSVPCAAEAAIEEKFGFKPITEHTLVPFTDALDIVENGSFELTASADALANWTVSAPNEQGFIGSRNFLLNDTRHKDTPAVTQIIGSGYRALRIKNGMQEESAALQTARVLRSAGWEEYACELGISFYTLSDAADVSLELAITMQSGDDEATESFTIPLKDELKKDEWVRKMYALTLPSTARSVGIRAIMASVGEVIIDDVVLLQACDQTFIDAKKPIEVLPPVEGTPANIIGLTDTEHRGNVDFEYDQPGNSPWTEYIDTPREELFSTNENHTPGGKRSLLLKNIETPRAVALQNVYGFVPGATYQVSWWYKVASEVQTTISYEFRWYNVPEFTEATKDLGLGSGDGYAAYQEDDWKQFVHTFVAPYPPNEGEPINANLRLRIGGKNGAAYFDDVAIYMVKEPEVAKVQSDEAIYYTEWRFGTIDAEVASYHTEKMQGGSLRYQILDGDAVIVPANTVPFAEADGKLKASGEFPTSVMEANKKGQTYSYKAEILDAAGTVLQEATGPIYRFDRPKYLDVDGIFRKNGREYNIGVGTSCNTKRINQGVADGGLEVIMMVGEGNLTLIEKLDAAHAAGLAVLMNMGDANSCAGSPTRIEQTKETVNLVKDHPALFGYKLQDEPVQKRTPEAELLTGYVTIRELDPNHVIYSCDGVEGDFATLARYTDYMDSDYYPGKNDKSGRHTFSTIQKAEAASRGRKPVAVLQKAYESAPSDTYFPAFEDFRHHAYQALFAGAGGWGYYGIGQAGTGLPFIERDVWKEVVAWEARGEQDLMFDCFVKGKYPLINACESEEVMWNLYAVDGKLYAFVVNCVGGAGAKEGSLAVNIPLTDAASGKNLGDFTAIRKWGAEGSASGKDVLSLEIPSFTVEVWEITLANPTDFSGYKTTKYNDITDAPWAYQAVAGLQEKNILNEDIDLRYEPQAQITRGDYAMFLVRALGLTADATENFADVKPYAEYADALAIGKALGIFEGVGDNRYNPDAPATRAEIMALTARALRLVGVAADGNAAALDAFSDKANVPEWATGDVAAMVSMGIVKGNADGTVNPLGNTTRAEAAVIVDRVMSR